MAMPQPTEAHDAAPPALALPDLEAQLTATLVEYELLETARPKMARALDRAEAGRKMDALLQEVARLHRQTTMTQATDLTDAAVQLRRLAHYVEDSPPACRLLASVMAAVEVEGQ